jgi:acetyl-CoA acetyltransferase
MTEEQIAGSAMISHPLTQYMYCSPAEGGVALVVCRADLAARYTTRPVRLLSATFRSRRFGSFEVFSPWLAPQRAESPAAEASRAAFEQAGVAPSDVDVAQVQDTEAGAEIAHMAECGLCEHGEQDALLREGATEIGGRIPVNTDGGCIANGEPVGASGLRQVYENVLQLRGDAGARQVPGDPSIAFSQVYGAPGISACTVLGR